MGCVDAKLLKVVDGSRTEQVIPNSRHHEHIRAAKPGGHCLIRALATKSKVKFLAEDGLPRLRKPVRECCQIDVGTSNHRNARAPRHVFPERTENAESIWRLESCQRNRVTDEQQPGQALWSKFSPRSPPSSFLPHLWCAYKEEYSYTLCARHNNLKENRCSRLRV